MAALARDGLRLLCPGPRHGVRLKAAMRSSILDGLAHYHLGYLGLIATIAAVEHLRDWLGPLLRPRDRCCLLQAYEKHQRPPATRPCSHHSPTGL